MPDNNPTLKITNEKIGESEIVDAKDKSRTEKIALPIKKYVGINTHTENVSSSFVAMLKWKMLAKIAPVETHDNP